MRHPYLRQGEDGSAFTDLLYNALLGFAFLFVTAFALITNPDMTGKIDPNAEVLISVSVSYTHLTLPTILLV